jgi:hypothetical protein
LTKDLQEADDRETASCLRDISNLIFPPLHSVLRTPTVLPTTSRGSYSEINASDSMESLTARGPRKHKYINIAFVYQLRSWRVGDLQNVLL